MDKDNKERLVLGAGLILTIGLGLTLELVKVPMKTVEVKIEKVPAYNMTMDIENQETRYEFYLPSKYKLAVDADGNPYGYKKTEIEKIEDVKLGDYLGSFIPIKKKSK